MRREMIKTKIKIIEEILTKIKKHLPSKYEEFKNLGLVKDGIYKNIEYAIETVFDICAIINADLNLGVPKKDEDIINNLKMNNIIPDEIVRKLKTMKGFRNILVHRYGEIDDALAFKILTQNFNDFNIFIDLVNKFLNIKK